MRKTDLIEEYLYRLRSPAKLDYAKRYLEWKARHPLHRDEPEPERGALSMMAAQAVRMNIDLLSR